MDVVIFCSMFTQENSDLDNLSTLESGLSKDTDSFPGQTALSIESNATTIDTLSDHDRVAPPIALCSAVSPVSCAIVQRRPYTFLRSMIISPQLWHRCLQKGQIWSGCCYDSVRVTVDKYNGDTTEESLSAEGWAKGVEKEEKTIEYTNYTYSQSILVSCRLRLADLHTYSVDYYIPLKQCIKPTSRFPYSYSERAARARGKEPPYSHPKYPLRAPLTPLD